MKQYFLSLLFSFFIVAKVFCTGYDIKTSDIIDQPGVEVLGDFQGCWYAIGFEKQSTLQKPPRYKIFKYTVGVRDAQSSPMYPSFGEKTLYLKSAFVSGKIAIFYAKCERLADKTALHDSLEGHSQIDTIFRQDYDPVSLAPSGEPEIVFTDNDDRFSASGIDIVSCEDKSKTAVLIKPWYKHQKYKLILSDNRTGQAYSRVYDFKALKEYWQFLKMKVNNQGQVFISTKVRTDVITLATSVTEKGKAEPHFDFLYINSTVGAQKIFSINSTEGHDRFFSEPSIGFLNSDELVVAFDVFAGTKSPVLKQIKLYKYDSDLNLVSKKDIEPDAAMVKLASDYQSAVKESAFSFLETHRVFPLEGGNFMLISEYHHISDNKDKSKPKILECGYLFAHRLDAQMAVKDFQFIPKKQTTSLYSYAMSAQVFRKGNDVYLFHNDDWESDDEHGMSLLCSKLAATGGAPETKKIVHTSDDFFPCMEHIWSNNGGKILISEEKTVDFEDVSREVKLLEVTLK